jgi:hypothetical protein
MTAKMSAARKEAFLAALAETGNASLSARQAGLSRSWVNKARAVDADLDARVAAARQAAAARLGACEGNRPPEAWRMRGGVELVLTKAGQVARAPGERRWTKRTEERFLRALGETRNLSIAAPAVGMSVASLEKHRAKWPAFDRRVRTALLLSARTLAMRLIEEDGGEWETDDAWDWPTGMSVADVINSVLRHKQAIGSDTYPARAAASAAAVAVLRAPQRRAAVRARIAELRARREARRRKAAMAQWA